MRDKTVDINIRKCTQNWTARTRETSDRLVTAENDYMQHT
jgi:hypothetical protein